MGYPGEMTKRPKRGRPQVRAAEALSCKVSVRLTRADYDRLQRIARGESVASLLRRWIRERQTGLWS